MRKGETVEQMIGRVVGKVGPTMMLTSFSESLAFFLGEVFVLIALQFCYKSDQMQLHSGCH